MKAFYTTSLTLALMFTSIATNAQIVCTGVDFDISRVRVEQLQTVKMVQDESEYYLGFTGSINGYNLRINIEKSSEQVHGFIDGAGLVSHTFTGGFTKSGNLEFNSMSGGNIMIPAKSIGISCSTK